MIDESKIYKAADDYVASKPSSSREAFIDGAQWAQQEFIKASEEPKPSVGGINALDREFSGSWCWDDDY